MSFLFSRKRAILSCKNKLQTHGKTHFVLIINTKFKCQKYFNEYGFEKKKKRNKSRTELVTWLFELSLTEPQPVLFLCKISLPNRQFDEPTFTFYIPASGLTEMVVKYIVYIDFHG
jgi:hypothetical protein